MVFNYLCGRFYQITIVVDFLQLLMRLIFLQLLMWFICYVVDVHVTLTNTKRAPTQNTVYTQAHRQSQYTKKYKNH